MVDQGEDDEKIIAVPFNDPTYNGFQDISELPEHIFNEMTHFFEVYKELEHKATSVEQVAGRENALEIIQKCIDDYIENYCK